MWFVLVFFSSSLLPCSCRLAWACPVLLTAESLLCWGGLMQPHEQPCTHCLLVVRVNVAGRHCCKRRPTNCTTQTAEISRTTEVLQPVASSKNFLRAPQELVAVLRTLRQSGCVGRPASLSPGCRDWAPCCRRAAPKSDQSHAVSAKLLEQQCRRFLHLHWSGQGRPQLTSLNKCVLWSMAGRLSRVALRRCHKI